MRKKKLATDIMWSIAALVLMNGTLQVAVYPYLNRTLGADAFGNVLFVLGIIAIAAPAIGLAANNTRLIERRDRTVENGDCLAAILLPLLPAALLFGMVTGRYYTGKAELVLAVAVLLLTTLRYYGDVEYRLTLHYAGYFAYYGAISAGYLAGLALLPYTHSWLLVFLLGEAAGTLLVFVRGQIYRPLRKSKAWRSFCRKTWILTLSYLLHNGVLNMDRILLQYLINSTAVSVYYVSSLLGKTAALLVGPLNGVVIGYLTKGSISIDRRTYGLTAAAILAAGGVLYAVILAVTPWFAGAFYPDLAQPVQQIAASASMAQVICFASSLLLTVMLTFCSERWQLAIQSVFAAAFIGIGIWATRRYGIQGFVWASLAANGIRMAATLMIGLVLAGSGKPKAGTLP